MTTSSDKVRIVDVGARGGADPRWIPFHAKIEVVAFEPDTEECERLNCEAYAYPIRFLPVALGSSDGQSATLHICRQPGCSSLLRPNTTLLQHFQYRHAMEIIGESTVTLARLDTVCRDFQPDTIKVDTQGTELEVLEGSGQLLDRVMAVEVEVEFVEQYAGQPVFADVDTFMRKKGFVLRGLRRTFWRNDARQLHAFGGQLVHGDALYLRPDEMNCPKGHVILAAYRQYDLLAFHGAVDLVPCEPRGMRVLSHFLSGFPNRELRRFVDRLRPADCTDWHDPDFF